MPTKPAQIPYNKDAEQAVLSSLLMAPDALYDLDLDAREFFNESHAQLFRIIREIASEGGTPDAVTIAARTNDPARWTSLLLDLNYFVPSPALIHQYAAEVRRDRIKRELADAATHIAELALNGHDVDTADLLTRAQSLLTKITTPERGAVIEIADAVAEYMPVLEAMLDDQKDTPGIETGFDFDKYIGGLIGGDLTIIGGYPGKGKTSLAMQTAFEVAGRGYRTLVFSLEMAKRQYMLRLVSTLAGVNSETIRRGQVQRESESYRRIKREAARIAIAPLSIVETSQSSETVRAQVIKQKQAGRDVQFVVVDYLDMLQDRAGNEMERVKTITRNMKRLARDLNVCVWLLHALNRGAELSLRSLMYGGDYDADEVMLCHFDDDRQDQSATIHIVKNRNGDTCKVPMIYDGRTTSWHNAARGSYE